MSDILEEITIEPFKFKHYNMLIEMLTDQKFPDVDLITMRSLPKIGYIAMLNKNPIAAGFLRRVEGNVAAQIDTLVSNPYFGSIIRHHGINKVLDYLITDAKSLKLKGIYALTIDKSILLRAEAMGFRVLGYSVIALPF